MFCTLAMLHMLNKPVPTHTRPNSSNVRGLYAGPLDTADVFDLQLRPFFRLWLVILCSPFYLCSTLLEVALYVPIYVIQCMLTSMRSLC